MDESVGADQHGIGKDNRRNSRRARLRKPNGMTNSLSLSLISTRYAIVYVESQWRDDDQSYLKTNDTIDQSKSYLFAARPVFQHTRGLSVVDSQLSVAGCYCLLLIKQRHGSHRVNGFSGRALILSKDRTKPVGYCFVIVITRKQNRLLTV